MLSVLVLLNIHKLVTVTADEIIKILETDKNRPNFYQ